MEKITDIKRLKLKANDIRQDIIHMVTQAQSGHPGGPLGLADVFACLYFNVLNHDPQKPLWKDRDRLILSNGHVCPVRYSTMAEAGYFPKEELLTFRKINSRLQGHPSRVDMPSLESSNASLGQGLGIAIGMALAARLDGRKNFVFCSLSDGECEEGSTWEAAMFAAKYKLDNLIAFVDRNKKQIDGDTEKIMPLEPFAGKWKAQNWNVIEADGHDFSQILSAFASAKKNFGKRKPTVIIFKTTMGKGVSFMEGNFEWHGKPPSPEQGQQALAELSEWRKRIEAE
ncbi:MAG: transketolase [Candidatus Norongarragalinales archaeon]